MIRRPRARLWGSAGCVLAALALGGPARADAMYVADRLMLGVHEEPSRNSPVITMLPSGTELEVVERDGAVARVRAPDGVEGWVDAAYLSDTIPASRRLEELEASTRIAEERLAEMERLREEAEERLAQREEELAGAVAEARTATAELEALERAPQADTRALSQALRDVQRMAEENLRLKQELAELEANRAMAAEHGKRPAAAGRAPARAEAGVPTAGGPAQEADLLAFLGWAPWQWMLLGSGLLLAFGAGGYMVDLGVRRRHGGFRV